ncbi:unnamed protein product [Rhizoctonia solani]|uniref:Protein ROT1 n=1 Tax=Rhizoctonia solani TaxID=456999 RepID=A0A8H2WAQ5_9AGAM|nr:unnamed protein product [Rhizoctonia solani]
MLFSTLFTAIVGTLPVLGQGVFDKNYKMTYLRGTWSTSNKNVPVGPSFANPAENKFFFPKENKDTESRTYSFTDDGFYEYCAYVAPSISSDNCTSALFIYQHGTYDFLSNGSMTLSPFAKDGRLQMGNSCKDSNPATPFNFTELMVTWSIDIESAASPVLNLHEANWERPQNLTLAYNPPQTLPTRPLTK